MATRSAPCWALGLTLRAAGKKVQMVLVDGVPASLRHLAGSRQVSAARRANSTWRWCWTAPTCCAPASVLGDRAADLNIDHHVTNLNFARINLVDPQAVATSAILAECLPRVGISAGKTDAAAALLTGIITDTIGFRTSNMTPTALRLAAGLMELRRRFARAVPGWAGFKDRLRRPVTGAAGWNACSAKMGCCGRHFIVADR